MARKTKTLTIPNSGGDLKLNKNQEQLEIHVSRKCQWCYDDPKHVFSSLPPQGPIDPGDYGPYIPKNDGQVTYGCPIDAPCKPEEQPETGHTITVSG
jgi:hypothetical protein